MRLPGTRCLGGPGREGLRYLAVVPDALVRDSREELDPVVWLVHSGGESDALREANTRIKLVEQENEVLSRAAAYTPRRGQAALRPLTPVQYELIMKSVATEAAQPEPSPARAAAVPLGGHTM
jgi:hypothetical protein